jgi:hypothetical protein
MEGDDLNGESLEREGVNRYTLGTLLAARVRT